MYTVHNIEKGKRERRGEGGEKGERRGSDKNIFMSNINM